LQTGGDLCPVSVSFLSRESLIRAALERFQDMSNETRRLLHVYKHFVEVPPIDEHGGGSDSDSSSDSDFLESDEEYWDWFSLRRFTFSHSFGIPS
jgi:hypothetical protein